jgi:transcriptional regulator with XRE-family HTH domain
MSLTLGEKLRQAREERGTSISEVAEQTRISALYIESIERDDYRTLPGGIFNKGFVKSFARYVGVDEQEALQDYARLVANQDNQIVDEPKTYRPEVLTDDRHASSSKLTTIVFAGVILTLMVAGILMLLRYIEPVSTQPATDTATGANANSIANITLPNTNTAVVSPVGAVSMNDLKVEFRALTAPVSLVSTTDGVRQSGNVTPDAPRILQPKKSLRLSYAKAQSRNVQLNINDKTIVLPTENPNRNVIEFEINEENLKQIWESGQISRAAAAPPR